MAKKVKNKKIKKQVTDAFILAIVICIGALVMFAVITLVASPTESFMLTESSISSEESKVRLCD